MSNSSQAPSQVKAKPSPKIAATTVNIMTVIDTDYIKATYGPNQRTKDNPQGLNKHEGITMICPHANYDGIINNDSAQIVFKANVGDTVSFWGLSLSGNSEDAVIIYNIYPVGSNPTNVFNHFHQDRESRTGAAIPDENSQDGIPALHVSKDFYTFDSKVANKGTESMGISFALYTLDDTRENQVFYGFYWWDPTIEVK
ncbi:inclusion body family protein [Chitinophaga filiformis]|uniref:inclusion body family protein n=1 Tax=Chitinophaga filiformis TaxID=104663 RepID=UPI001F481D43|nr:inclusion body family protein [Chitinophaga filiformis]MCF6407929.1 inclusion body family protein [Chitinophaga filiformis]